MQTKKHSLIEAITNTAVGFIISLAATFLIFPLVGVESTVSKNVLITLFYTVISILRGYVIRRIFNKSKVVANTDMIPFTLHCFECEIEMPVYQNSKNELFCTNCGLKH